MKHAERFIWLDLIRGLSALAVCAGHLRAAMLVDFGDVQSPSLATKIFYFLTGLGHQAVIVFFVLSGFFVGGSILKAGEGFSLLHYGVARLTRLWIVLVPALLITVAVDLIIGRSAPQVLEGKFYDLWVSGPAPGQYSVSALTFLGNLFFVQTIFTPVFGTNGPLWSLANEFWYYFLFPLITFAVGYSGSQQKVLFRGLSALCALGLLFALPEGISTGFAVWMMGTAVYMICRNGDSKRRPLFLLATLALFAGALFYSKAGGMPAPKGLSKDLLVGLATSLLCVVVASWPSPSSTTMGEWTQKLSRSTSEFSYSLYLIHFPFVLLIAVHAFNLSKVAPRAESILEYMGWLVLLVALGAVYWYLFERHTLVLRKSTQRFLESKFCSPKARIEGRSGPAS